MKKYPAIDTESRIGLQFHKKISICCVSILGAFKSVEKKKVSHNDMTSYCHQHIICNYGGGGGRGEPQVPLSSFLTAAAYLFCFVFVSFPFHLYKKFEELSPIYIFCYGHKNAGLESAFVRKLQYCSLSSFFSLSSLFHWVQKSREKRVVFYLNNCHQSRLFDGGARIIIWWSWVHSTGQQVKLLTRHRKGYYTVRDIRDF